MSPRKSAAVFRRDSALSLQAIDFFSFTNRESSFLRLETIPKLLSRVIGGML